MVCKLVREISAGQSSSSFAQAVLTAAANHDIRKHLILKRFRATRLLQPLLPNRRRSSASTLGTQRSSLILCLLQSTVARSVTSTEYITVNHNQDSSTIPAARNFFATIFAVAMVAVVVTRKATSFETTPRERSSRSAWFTSWT